MNRKQTLNVRWLNHVTGKLMYPEILRWGIYVYSNSPQLDWCKRICVLKNWAGNML